MLVEAGMGHFDTDTYSLTSIRYHQLHLVEEEIWTTEYLIVGGLTGNLCQASLSRIWEIIKTKHGATCWCCFPKV